MPDVVLEAADPARPPLSEKRPFPGPHSYTEEDERFFKGRREEAEQLSYLVSRNRLVVLFGASGLGKSSLLSAGLFPRLRQEGFLPIAMRLEFAPGTARKEPALNLTSQVMARVRREAKAKDVEAERSGDCETLWEYFHRLELWGEGLKLLTPVLVVDQFEEAFTLGQHTAERRAAVEAFFSSLGDLVENRAPREVLRNPEDRRCAYLDREPPVRVVLSLREEYLPHLEAWRRKIPAISRNRMRILPFGGDGAVEAIMESAPDLLDLDVSRSIVRAVAETKRGINDVELRPSAPENTTDTLEGLQVEPSLLNLFCYQLNERRLAAEKPTPKIEASLVETAGDDILDDFYRDSLKGLPKAAQHFIEEKLLSDSGYRLPVPLDDAFDYPGMTKAALDLLEKRRLIRRDTRYQAIYVELVHDVLAQTIKDAKARDRVQRRIQWLRRGIGVASAAAIFTVGFFLFQIKTKGDAGVAALNPELKKQREQLWQTSHEVQLKAGELEASKQALEKSKRALETTQARLLAETKARSALETEWEAAQAAVTEAKTEADSARKAADAARLAAGRLEEQQATAKAALAIVLRDRNTAQGEKEELERRRDELRKEAAELKKQIQLLNKEHGIPRLEE